jgi:hypothetical protein
MALSQENEDPGYKRLFELETEYRAPRVADRLHAIVSFSYLFDDFPNPTIINSGFLKLADYFAGRYDTYTRYSMPFSCHEAAQDKRRKNGTEYCVISTNESNILFFIRAMSLLVTTLRDIRYCRCLPEPSDT